jgi:hypothetical protein
LGVRETQLAKEKVAIRNQSAGMDEYLPTLGARLLVYNQRTSCRQEASVGGSVADGKLEKIRAKSQGRAESVKEAGCAQYADPPSAEELITIRKCSKDFD